MYSLNASPMVAMPVKVHMMPYRVVISIDRVRYKEGIQ